VGLVVAALATLAAGGCGSGPSASSSPGAVSIVATTTQLADFAHAIGGHDVRVYGILKANVDPHDYEPSPADVEKLRTADVIVENGVGLEKWFDGIIRSASPKGAIVDTSVGVALRGHDPHIWHNPRDAIAMVTTVERALVAAAPAYRSRFEARLAAYTARLEELDAWIKTQIDSLPNKKLVTNHDALGYYVDRYGLEFVGSIIPSMDTSAELSAKDVSGIVARIKTAGVKAVFSESSLPPKTAEAIGTEAGVKVVAGENALYGDTLGPAGSGAATYLEMERHNTKVIVDNLR
jgi:zinc/manganese transport system substrate-binding protein/manganese/iron transport system substrate-binding protein